MKKAFKKVTTTLTAMLMMFGSTFTVAGSVSAVNNEMKARRLYIYGDVDDDRDIDINDAVFVSQFMASYKNEHGNTIISVEDAVKYTGKYRLTVPQAADVDGDGYITEADEICIQYYEAQSYDKTGRCGQTFFID